MDDVLLDTGHGTELTYEPGSPEPTPLTNTGLLRRRVEDTKHYESLSSQGLNFRIPPDFINQPQIPGLSLENRDPLTQLPIETDEARRMAIKLIGDELRKGGDVAIEAVDGDNIKVLNLTDRELGDLGIVYSAARTSQGVLLAGGQSLSSLPTRPEDTLKPRVIVFRQKDAADETVAIHLGVTPEYIDNLREQREKDDAETHTTHPDASFSQTSSLISTTDLNMVGLTLKTRRWLQADPEHNPFNFYKAIRELLDTQVKDEKERKQWGRLSDSKYFLPIELKDLHKTIAEEYGGGRVSKAVLEYFLKYSAVMDIRTRAIAINESGGDVDTYLGFNNLTRADVARIDSQDRVIEVFAKMQNTT